MSSNDHNEAIVTIDGKALTNAQAMTLRVAMSSFLVDISKDDEDRGGAIYRLYAERGREVEQMLVDGANRKARAPMAPVGAGPIIPIRPTTRPIWDTVAVDAESSRLITFFVGNPLGQPSNESESLYFGTYRLMPPGSIGRIKSIRFFIDDKPLRGKATVALWVNDAARFRAPLWLIDQCAEDVLAILSLITISSEDLCKVEVRFDSPLSHQRAHRCAVEFRCAATIEYAAAIDR